MSARRVLFPVFLLTLILVGCSQSELSVRTQKLEKKDLYGDYLATGRVSSKTLSLSPEVSGKLRELKVEPGQTVESGAILAVVEDQDLEAHINNLEVSVRAARSLRDEALRSVSAKRLQLSTSRSRAEAEVSRAQWRLAELRRGPREAELRRLEAAVAEASANLELARKEREALEQLFVDDIVAKVDLDRAEASEKVALARRSQAAQNLNDAKAGATFEQLQSGRAEVRIAQANLDALESNGELQVMEQQLQTRELELTRLESDLRSARERFSRSVLRAPEPGSVSRVHKSEGELAHYGAPLLTLIVGDELWIEADVSEQDARFVTLHQRVKVTLPSRPNREYEGRVAEVASSLEGVPGNPGTARFLHIKVELEEAAERELQPGLEADIRGSLKLASEAVVAPLGAVYKEADKDYLLTVAEGKVRAVPVTLGALSGSEVQIVDGLEAGREIIVDGAQPSDRGRSVKQP